jgi:hypothetical protein
MSSCFAIAALAAPSAQAQGLGGMAEPFPSGQPVDVLPTLAGRLQGVGVPGAEVLRNVDGSTTLRGIPLSSDVAARLNQVLGGAVPGTAPLGQGVPDVLGATRSRPIPLLAPSPGRGLAIPGLTPAQGSALIEGASNLISAPPGAVPGVPQ